MLIRKLMLAFAAAGALAMTTTINAPTAEAQQAKKAAKGHNAGGKSRGECSDIARNTPGLRGQARRQARIRCQNGG